MRILKWRHFKLKSWVHLEYHGLLVWLEALQRNTCVYFVYMYRGTCVCVHLHISFAIEGFQVLN